MGRDDNADIGRSPQIDLDDAHYVYNTLWPTPVAFSSITWRDRRLARANQIDGFRESPAAEGDQRWVRSRGRDHDHITTKGKIGTTLSDPIIGLSPMAMRYMRPSSSWPTCSGDGHRANIPRDVTCMMHRIESLFPGFQEKIHGQTYPGGDWALWSQPELNSEEVTNSSRDLNTFKLRLEGCRKARASAPSSCFFNSNCSSFESTPNIKAHEQPGWQSGRNFSRLTESGIAWSPVNRGGRSSKSSIPAGDSKTSAESE
jgi:hypothetical protein